MDSNASMIFLVILCLFAAGFGLTLALLRLSLYWLQRQTARQFEARFREANEIIQGGCPPEPWVSAYRQRIDHLRRTGKSTQALQRVGTRAQKTCLRKLDTLAEFLENGRFYESLETRTLLVDELYAIRDRWAASSWEMLLAPPGEQM
jgi:hypothetical protein